MSNIKQVLNLEFGHSGFFNDKTICVLSVQDWTSLGVKSSA